MDQSSVSDSNASSPRGKRFKTSALSMSVEAAAKILEIDLNALLTNTKPLKSMIDEAAGSLDANRYKTACSDQRKAKIHRWLTLYMNNEGPVGCIDETVVQDYVCVILNLVFDEFRLNNKTRKFTLARNSFLFGEEDFDKPDFCFLLKPLLPGSYTPKVALIVEAKSAFKPQSYTQTMMYMKKIFGRQNTIVYALLTTGDAWRLITLDHTGFQLSDTLNNVMDPIELKDPAAWAKHEMIVADLIISILGLALQNDEIERAGQVLPLSPLTCPP